MSLWLCEHPLDSLRGGSVRAFDQVPVNVERHSCLAVAEAARDRKDIDANPDQGARMAVAQAMERDAGQLPRLAGLPPRAANAVRLEVVAFDGREHECRLAALP